MSNNRVTPTLDERAEGGEALDVPQPTKSAAAMRRLASRQEQQDLDFEEEDVGWLGWVKSRWWAVALLVLLAIGILVAVIVGSVCGVLGCPRKSSEQEMGPVGPPRLIVSFSLESVDALALIPALLQQYTSRIRLESSLLQLLNFTDESVLQRAIPYIQQEASLTLLARDFLAAYNPDGVTRDISSVPGSIDLTQLLSSSTAADLINSVTGGNSTDLSSLLGRRQLLQQQQLQAVPVNDPFITNRTQWHQQKLRTDLAWAVTPGSGTVVVAIIDTGFDLTHPDLGGSLWVNAREIPGNGIDDDGNGFIDDVNGWDFAGGCQGQPDSYNTLNRTCQCRGRPNAVPANWHGTHVAGLVGATANNSRGGAGTGPGIKLMLLRAADCKDGTIWSFYVYQALDYAFKNGAHIVSMSIGMSYSWQFMPNSWAPSYYQDWLTGYTLALQPLATKGVLVVAAAGNEALSIDSLMQFNWTYNPCVTPLDNVICVAATDVNDTLASYSNYGSYVDVAAPGSSILSTLWTFPSNHIYGQLSGTSMATPITAGVAALVASVLGSVDGNYFKAAQIKSILMSSGDPLPSLQGMVASNNRINAYSAAYTALQAISSTNNVPSVAPSVAATAAFGVVFPGWNETAWTNINPQVLATAGQTQLDATVFRATAPVFVSTKYTSGSLEVMTSYLRVNTTGVHTFQVSASTTVYWRISVNGQAMSVNNSLAAFTATAPGWYLVSFAFTTPGVPTLNLRPPGAATFGLYDGSYSLFSTASYVAPQGAANWTGVNAISLGWMVWYNKTNGVSFNAANRNVMSNNITPTSTWQFQTQVQDIQYSSQTIKGALMPGDTTTNSMMGYAFTILTPNALMGTSFQFRLTCKGCALLLNNLLILEMWESMAAPIALAKFSGCITLTPNTSYHLALKFAMSPLSSAALSASWQPCGSTFPVQSIPQGVASLSPMVWDTSYLFSTRSIGYIGGVQCDAYKTGLLTPTIPTSTAPLYKVRLPRCSSPETLTSTCSTPWSFSLNTMFPGGLSTRYPSATHTWSVRCWTYLGASLPSPSLTASPLTTTSAITLTLAGTTRFTSGPGTTASITWPMPATVIWGTTQNLLVVDYLNVTGTDLLRVMAGGTPLVITPSNTQLPLWVTFDLNQNGDPTDTLLGLKPIGAGGVFSQVTVTNTTDILAIVAASPLQVGTLNSSASTSTTGLQGTFLWPTSTAIRSTSHYGIAEGYLYCQGQYPDPYIFTFYEAASSATQVVASAVVLRNPPSFSATSAAAVVQFQVYLPNGYLRMSLNTKSTLSNGGVFWNWTVTETNWPTYPVDNWVWNRASWQPQTP